MATCENGHLLVVDSRWPLHISRYDLEQKVDKTHVPIKIRKLMSRLRMRDFHFDGTPSLNPETKSIETSMRCSHMKNGHLMIVHSRWTVLISRYDLEHVWVKIGNLIFRLRMPDYHFVGAPSLNPVQCNAQEQKSSGRTGKVMLKNKGAVAELEM